MSSANARSSWLWSARSRSGAPADADVVTWISFREAHPSSAGGPAGRARSGGSGGFGAFALSELVHCGGADPKDFGSNGFAGGGGVVGRDKQQGRQVVEGA